MVLTKLEENLFHLLFLPPPSHCLTTSCSHFSVTHVSEVNGNLAFHTRHMLKFPLYRDRPIPAYMIQPNL